MPDEILKLLIYITKFNTLTLPNRYKVNILLFVHKFFHHRNQLPHVFSSYFVQTSELHSYNTRIKDKPHFPSVGSNLVIDQPNTKEHIYGVLYLKS